MPRRSVSSPVPLPAFQLLLDDHGRDVHRFLTAILGRDGADDAYQETWLAALRAYPRVRNAANLRGWILTVAHRKALDQLRARKRAPAPVAEVPEPRHPQAVELNGSTDVWHHVRALPPKQRTAVALRYLLDAPYAQISAVMGTSEQAARRNVHEGLKRLRSEYTP